MSLREGVAVDIVKAERVSGYRLRLEFDDGHRSLVDLGPYLNASWNPQIRKFLDETEFGRFTIVDGNLVWGDYDLCFPLEDLYEGAISATHRAEKPRAVAEDRGEYGPDKPQGVSR